MEKVYIVAAKRTAIGKFLGALSTVPVAEFGATVVEAILTETKVKASDINEVIVGNVLMAGQFQGVARQISVKAGIPYEIPAYGVNMICGSGMKAVMNGFNSIRVGEADIIIAGGAESMSGSGFIIPPTIRNGTKMADFNVKDHMITDALTDAFSGLHMGITAENIAKDLDIDREEQDAFSIQSQQRAIAAIDGGKFKTEIVPVEVKSKKFSTMFEQDEFPNRETTLEKLSFLRPAFQNPGTVTAGNASGINDGAAFVMLASESAIKKYNLKPLMEIVAVGQAGVNPAKMGLGPVPAINNALSKTNIKLKDIELFELNEAFAAQALGVRQLLCQQHNISPDWINERCNVNGGAIALGHPVGASGCRIIVTLIHEMLRSKRGLGLASLCIGGGMGTAIILKNTNNQ
ncbi:MAG: acetyl-CoA C-acetyltransferase [Bacteroidales bacterium]|nr:acetyl-CoA C-acetyltransferase [Bacteroidales bacterium]MDD4830190.1 acetyl-CoA C-acetyltransferase [Bacteroidales bacterium]